MDVGFGTWNVRCVTKYYYGYNMKTRLAGHVACIGDTRNAYNIVVGKPDGKRPVGESRRRGKDIIRMDLKEIGWDGMEWMHLAQDRDQWRSLVNKVIKLRVP
jgi:hypothetical protein